MNQGTPEERLQRAIDSQGGKAGFCRVVAQRMMEVLLCEREVGRKSRTWEVVSNWVLAYIEDGLENLLDPDYPLNRTTILDILEDIWPRMGD